MKGSQALERLATVDTFAFDKTGTLTRGELAVGEILALDRLDEIDVLRTAAMAECHSEHLLARAIVREAEQRGCVVPGIDDFAAEPGSGVVARARSTQLGPWSIAESTSLAHAEPRDHGRTIVVGNRGLIERQGITVPDSVDPILQRLDKSGQTALIVAVDDSIRGVIGIRDSVRAESVTVLRELRDAGIEHMVLLTGDRSAVAENVAGELTLLDSVESELLPADKAAWLESAADQGWRVAMVGDGANDAPALGTARVGGVGSEIAAEAGDLVLMGDPLRPLPGLLRLSRQLVRNIRQSIYCFAFGINALGVVLCAWGILSPVAGAIFHEFSSLAVMLNAMRLLWFESWGNTSAGRRADRFAARAERVAEALSPSRLVYRVLDNRFLMLRLAAAALALYWLAFNLVRIDPHEEALVTRFGRFHATLDPGVYWRWPPPFERMLREKTGLLRSLEVGFRSNARRPRSDESVGPPIEWTNEHQSHGVRVLPDESVILTGDEVPIEVTATVHYRISDLYRFASGSRHPQQTLRAVTESVLRQVIGGTSLDGILTNRRADVERECLQLAGRQAAMYDIGLQIVDVNLLDVHPPRAVVPSYRDVADAMEEREQRVNEAEAWFASRLLSVAGERAVQRLLAHSSAPADPAAARAEYMANWSLDDDLWAELAERQDGGRRLITGEGAAELLAAEGEREATISRAKGAAARYLSLLHEYHANPKLSGRQLYLSTIDETLSSRPLTIIDPVASARQHLMLADPDEFGAGPLLRPMSSSEEPNVSVTDPFEEESSPQ